MTLQATLIGGDGALGAALPYVLAAETGALAASLAEEPRVVGPDEDYLAPRFHPDGGPPGGAAAAAWIVERYRPAVLVSDGCALGAAPDVAVALGGSAPPRALSTASGTTILRVPTDGLSPGEILRQLVAVLTPHLLARRAAAGSAAPLGAPPAKLGGASLFRKILRLAYLRHLAREWFRGAWREPLFALSRAGRLLLAEGYSAEVMRAIYDQRAARAWPLARAFFGYPLHRAVRDRLGILERRIEAELLARLALGREVTVFTAPSGFAYDLLRPLARIAARDSGAARRVRVVASDLDPRGRLGPALAEAARAAGVRLEFIRGDLTHARVAEALGRRGPFDVALFVGLSGWLPLPALLRHFEWLRRNVAAGGVLATDAFTPGAYALSGRLVGWKAHYYEPEVYRALLDYCGFDGTRATVESGANGINHVVIAAPRTGAGLEAKPAES